MNTNSFLRLRATEGYRATENLPTLESLLCDNVEAMASLATTFMSFDEDEDYEEEDDFEDDEYDGTDDEDDYEEEEDEDYEEDPEEDYEEEDEDEA